MSRRDVIIVASVSCIYGLGSPEFYKDITIEISKGDKLNRDKIIKQLIKMHYTRTEVLERSRFRAHGPVIEIVPPDKEIVWRIELDKDDVVKEISERDLMGTEHLPLRLSNNLFKVF